VARETGRANELARQRYRRKRAEALRAAGMLPAPRAWWSVTRASVELGCTERWARRLASDGVLAAVRDNDGKSWRIDPQSVAALIAQREAA
jgi:hypothetical protein